MGRWWDWIRDNPLVQVFATKMNLSNVLHLRSINNVLLFTFCNPTSHLRRCSFTFTLLQAEAGPHFFFLITKQVCISSNHRMLIGILFYESICKPPIYGFVLVYQGEHWQQGHTIVQVHLKKFTKKQHFYIVKQLSMWLSHFANGQNQSINVIGLMCKHNNTSQSILKIKIFST